MRLFFFDEPHALLAAPQSVEFNEACRSSSRRELPCHPAVALIAISHRLVDWC